MNMWTWFVICDWSERNVVTTDDNGWFLLCLTAGFDQLLVDQCTTILQSPRLSGTSGALQVIRTLGVILLVFQRICTGHSLWRQEFVLSETFSGRWIVVLVWAFLLFKVLIWVLSRFIRLKVALRCLYRRPRYVRGNCCCPHSPFTGLFELWTTCRDRCNQQRLEETMTCSAALRCAVHGAAGNMFDCLCL